MLCCAFLLMLTSPVFALWAVRRREGGRHWVPRPGSVCCVGDGSWGARRVWGGLGLLAIAAISIVALMHLSHLLAPVPSDLCTSPERPVPTR